MEQKYISFFIYLFWIKNKKYIIFLVLDYF